MSEPESGPLVLDPPEDLDEFWRTAERRAHEAPLDFHRSSTNDFELPGFIVETIAFRGIGGETLHGWLAYSPEARRLPGFLWIPPYGRESLLPNAYGTRSGFTSFSFNFHGLPSFHQEQYTPARGYFAQGVQQPETWVFRKMAQNAMIAARVLQAQIEVDEERVGAMGMSQGGGMAIWLGAFCSAVKAVCADMPFLGTMRSTLARTAYRYPLKELIDFADTLPLGRETVLGTLAYFDTVDMATRCKVPTQVSLGLKDPASRPETVRAIFDALDCEKRLIELDWGHDWHPDMIANNAEWLTERLG